MSTPLPPGRGLWRLTLHNRSFAGAAGTWQTSLIAELTSARGRLLEQNLNAPAKLSFTLNGASAEAQLIKELQHEVVAWRWDTGSGADVPYFRGIVGQSEDQLTEQSHTVNFVCHDNLAMLARRYLTNVTPLNLVQTDQDNIVSHLVSLGTILTASGGTAFSPGSALPVTVLRVNPDGTARVGFSGVLRDRNYAGQSAIGDLITQLGAVIGGFDFDITPGWRVLWAGTQASDALRVFYPSQGVVRTEPLEFGGGIATVTRTADSGDYTNYWRVIGNNGSSDPNAPQLYSEAFNADSNNVGAVPVGTWMGADTGADVSLQATLDQQAQGNLNRSGVLVPSYALGLRGGVYAEGMLNMGDTVPIVIQSGRLNVNSSVRVVGLTFTIGDDGQEDVGLTVGRPATSLVSMLTATAADVNALARR
jgi:hypothetical protein